MLIRKLALWACLLGASSSFADTIKIKESDNSLEAVAKRTGHSVKDLKKANPGLDDRRLRPGQKIKTPGSGDDESPRKKSKNSTKKSTNPGGKYKVSEDDNGWTVAKKYGISVEKLAAMNPDVNLNRMRPGTTLAVPGGNKAKAEKAVAKKATAPKKPEFIAPNIKTGYAKVKADAATLRKEPKTDGQKIRSLDSGTVGKITGRSNGWYRLEFSDSTQGWVRGDLVASATAPVVAKAAPAKPVEKPTLTPTTTEPGEETVVTVEKTETGGAVAKAERKPKPKTKPAQDKKAAPEKETSKVIGMAKSLLGTRYVWGGTSRGGFDCSGFVGYVMRNAGISLPRTAIEQSSRGTYVSRGELRSGDLIFFNTRGGRISHVGIYIGNNNFIHASSGKGRVIISELSGYYANRYVTGRRVGQFKDVSRAVEQVQKELEEAGELPTPADKPERRVQPGTDEVGE